MQLIDENAYGYLFSYLEIEDDEYSLQPEEFVFRVVRFREVIHSALAEQAPGEGCRVVELGHAIYLEVAEGEETVDPFSYLKRMRGLLEECEIPTAAVLSHGSRWVVDPESDDPPSSGGGGAAAYPSEALRRALYADTACQPGDDEELEPGWGAGLYVDTEAIEAMGKVLKNAPTPLAVAGATFYRFGR